MKKIDWVRYKLIQGYSAMRVKTALWGILALVWCGLFYPEICFTKDTYQLVDAATGKVIELQDDELEKLLHADSDEILIGSRLMEWLEKLKDRLEGN